MKWNIAVAACCVLLLVANVALIRQNRQLKAQLSLPPPKMEAEAGARVPDLKGFDLSGRPVVVAYGEDPRKVLVFVFSPTCTFCDQNWPQWWALMQKLDRGAVRPVAVDVTAASTAGFLAEHRFNDIPVMVQVDPASRINYRLQLTPQTILVDGSGRVEKVWSGVLGETALAEIERRAGTGKAGASQSSGQ